jgi:hypothetical protein
MKIENVIIAIIVLISLLKQFKIVNDSLKNNEREKLKPAILFIVSIIVIASIMLYFINK